MRGTVAKRLRKSAGYDPGVKTTYLRQVAVGKDGKRYHTGAIVCNRPRWMYLQFKELHMGM